MAYAIWPPQKQQMTHRPWHRESLATETRMGSTQKYDMRHTMDKRWYYPDGLVRKSLTDAPKMPCSSTAGVQVL
ncbi:hypothetical protein BV25DRAFT_1825844 [Artomyces pyxidatus]|uniref:Uncharacterized protein n=1 Tax=Artomyces pyxidatus TaxID=48021 RepID=A0ACB8T0H0_9AGAM|nr:hypothetical protein BV25DRAFT_1825844 [Artomyces pyxidatus]